MKTKTLKNQNIMLSKFKDILEDAYPEDSHLLNEISEQELIDALDNIGQDLIYNYLIFGREVSFKEFVSNLKIYINIFKTRL